MQQTSSILNLPNEILLYIFSQQNERHLIEVVSRVCKTWNQTVHLDSLWSTAFAWKWGTLPLVPRFFRSSKGKSEKKAVFWRREYIFRQHIEMVWKYGAFQAVSFDTSLGGSLVNTLTFAADDNGYAEHFQKKHGVSTVSNNNRIPRLIAGSVESGLVVTCNSKTGKISRSVLKICKKEEEEFEMNDTVSCIYSENVSMNMSWILGTKLDGSIMACFQTDDDSTQGVVNSTKLWFPRAHSQNAHILLPISEISSLKEVSEKLFHFVDSDTTRQGLLHSLHRSKHLLFLSANIDGKVGLYSTLFPSQCLAEFIGNQEPISCMTYFEDTFIAGTSTGKILFWKIPKEKLLHSFQNYIFETLSVSLFKEVPISKQSSLIVKIFGDEISRIIIAQQFNGDIFHTSFSDILKSPQYLDHQDKTSLSGVQFLPSNNMGSPGLLATGYKSGNLSLWAVYPSKPFQFLSTLQDQKNPISCIYLSSTLLITGSDDGSIYIYDAISFKILRGLNNKYRNQNILHDRFQVNNIVNYGSILCITQSSSITSWFIRQKLEKAGKKSVGVKFPISYCKAIQSSSSSHSRQDVEHDILETLESVDTKRMILKNERKLVISANGDLKTHNMSEQELVEYAKVLSLDESELAPVPDYGNLTDAEALELALALSLSESTKS